MSSTPSSPSGRGNRVPRKSEPWSVLPWKVFAAGPSSKPHTIEIHDASGAVVISWTGFDRSELSRSAHLRNAQFIVEKANG